MKSLLLLCCVFCLWVLVQAPPPADDESSLRAQQLPADFERSSKSLVGWYDGKPDSCGIPDDDENEDIEEPVMSWREALCVPRGYRPPEALLPDLWHPANKLINQKP